MWVLRIEDATGMSEDDVSEILDAAGIAANAAAPADVIVTVGPEIREYEEGVL